MNNYLYAAGDGGFHRSLDDGPTWTNLYNGINTAQFYHLDDYDGNQTSSWQAARIMASSTGHPAPIHFPIFVAVTDSTWP